MISHEQAFVRLKNGSNQKRERRHKPYPLVCISALENGRLLATEHPIFHVLQNLKLLYNLYLVLALIDSLDPRPSVSISEREKREEKDQNADATYEHYRTND